MGLIQLFLFVVFVVLTVVGFKKNSRELMLYGAIAGGVGFIGLEFILGFIEGVNGA